jgi:sulfide dehydrogenase cytochrome subunit
MKHWTKALAAVTVGTASAWACADALQVRSMAAACANCHGTNGVAQPGMVSLAGQSKDDLRNKMLEFKGGKRAATIMHQLAKGYSDEQIEQLAGYFSAIKP